MGVSEMYISDDDDTHMAGKEENKVPIICGSKDTQHILRIAALLHILNFNILRALGLRRGQTPGRIEKKSILRAKSLYHACAQQKNIFLQVGDLYKV